MCTVFTWLLMDRILGARAEVEWVLVRLGGGLCLGLLVCVCPCGMKCKDRVRTCSGLCGCVDMGVRLLAL